MVLKHHNLVSFASSISPLRVKQAPICIDHEGRRKQIDEGLGVRLEIENTRNENPVVQVNRGIPHIRVSRCGQASSSMP
jgi:hypothetical protein